MQSNDKAISIKIAGPESVSKWHSRRHKTNDTTVDKTESQPKSQPKSQTNLDNNSKTTPNKTVVKNDKKTNNNSNINNKRTKGPFVSQLHNQIKARFNLNASASKSISSLRPTHVFASTTSPHCSHKRENEPKLADGVSQPRDHCQLHHSFISDITDVRQMENTLLQLLDDFHSGKLQAFGQDITFEKMESVREQQERLARLHFDLNLQQEVYGHQTEEGKRMAKDNMSKLIENLQQLSNSMYPFLNVQPVQVQCVNDIHNEKLSNTQLRLQFLTVFLCKVLRNMFSTLIWFSTHSKHVKSKHYIIQ